MGMVFAPLLVCSPRSSAHLGALSLISGSESRSWRSKDSSTRYDVAATALSAPTPGCLALETFSSIGRLLTRNNL